MSSGNGTNTLIAQLQAIFPTEQESLLLHALTAAEGDIERAVDSLLEPQKHSRKKRRSSSKQVTIDTWVSSPQKKPINTDPLEKQANNEIIIIDDDDDQDNDDSTSSSLRSINEVLKHDNSTSTSAPAALPPLYLATPNEVSQHLPCSVINKVLPPELADDLFLSMLDESHSWNNNRWNLAGRDVVSPHTTSFYVCPTHSPESYAQEASFWYNGRKLKTHEDVKTFSHHMMQAKNIIEPIVNQHFNRRQRFGLEYDGEWIANVAATTCYTGAKQNVGWHSDALTYLGPYPTIASLSLGCTRLFRLRDPRGASVSSRTYEFTMSHNTLVIMHAGCQERFKHCVPPQASIDVFRPRTKPNIEESYTQRINITFRFYRPDFHPSHSSKPGTPICNCGLPCILRPDAKGKVAAKSSLPINTSIKDATSNSSTSTMQSLSHNDDEDSQKYWMDKSLSNFKFFWMCNAGAQNNGKSCGMFRVLDMKAESRGPCIAWSKK